MLASQNSSPEWTCASRTAAAAAVVVVVVVVVAVTDCFLFFLFHFTSQNTF